MRSQIFISRTSSNLALSLEKVLSWLRARFVLGIYLVVVVIFLIVPFTALQWTEKPFLGFLIEQTMVVADYNGSNWSGRLAGMNYPEKVSKINGVNLYDQTEFNSIVGELKIGQVVNVETVLPDGSTRTYPEIQAMNFPRVDYLRLFWLPYLVGVAYLAIAGWVYRVKGDTRPGRSFVIFCLSSALALGLLFDLITSHVFSLVWLIAISSLGGALLSLSIHFPEEAEILRKRPYFRPAPFLISIGLLIWGAMYLFSTSNPWQYIQTWRISYIYSAIGILIFISVMIYRMRLSRSHIVQQQVRTILVGSLISFMPISIWMGAPAFGILIPWNPAFFLPILLIFPMTIAIAIVRYRLWDIEIIINRALVYAVLTLLLGSFYFISVVSIQTIISGVFGNPTTIATAASTLGVALLFNPLRRQVQQFIDRRFFRRKYDISQTMIAFIERIRDEVDLENLTNALISVVYETMEPTSITYCDCMELDNQSAQLPADESFRSLMLTAGEVVEVDKLRTDSPAVVELKNRRENLAVPLISQGELVGILMMGAKCSDQNYSAEDYRLLNMLATQVAPVLRVAHLVKEMQEEALNLQRVEQELQIARMIQQSLIPEHFPNLEGWQFGGFYKPAREVGGDFYDFVHFPDGRIAVLIGDVAGKGIPAALVMANTRSLLRSTAYQLINPASVLRKVNDLLLPEIPSSMFVTCFYALIDTASGKVTFANAGHNLPYTIGEIGVEQLDATGMPLGWMPDRTYEEREIILSPGESILLYSDGLVEAHDDKYEMFGNPRLHSILSRIDDKLQMIDILVSEYKKFSESRWGQEDDVTLMVIHRIERE